VNKCPEPHIHPIYDYGFEGTSLKVTWDSKRCRVDFEVTGVDGISATASFANGMLCGFEQAILHAETPFDPPSNNHPNRAKKHDEYPFPTGVFSVDERFNRLERAVGKLIQQKETTHA
jgi:hypothetical protein